MPPKRMTANPVRPARYRAGKPTGAESSSESESDDEQQQKPAPTRKIAPPPKAPSAGRIISSGPGAKIDFKSEEEARRVAAARARAEAEKRARDEGFVTEDEDEESGGDKGEEGSEEGSGSEEESSEEEESESEEEAPRRLMMRPKFIPKSARGGEQEKVVTEEEEAEAEAARKKAEMDEMVEEQIRKDLAAKASGKKHWEDDTDAEEEEVDDTDDIDPEAEYAAWKLRELKRIRRDREAIEEKEKEREEIERRRNLTEDERRAEDAEYIAKQEAEKEGKGPMAYMQKYFHKGAFYQDELSEEGLAKRDIMGTRFQDDVKNRELLPKALQMRDMTKLGKKGATKYRDLKSEDTGRWGELDGGRRPGNGVIRGVDERFQPDQDRGWDRERGGGGEEGPKGSNAIPLGDRKAAPEGRREDRGGDRDRYRPRDDDRERRRERSRSRSPRRDHRERERSRDRDDHRERRKRSSSRGHDCYESDKRRRVDSR